LAGPSDVKRFAADRVLGHRVVREHHRVHQVLDEEHVAHLQTVAVERERAPLHGLNQEVRDPALVAFTRASEHTRPCRYRTATAWAYAPPVLR
jgi:hypothetical protein